MNTGEIYMQHALRQAQMAREADEVPVGAVIVREGEIIARAHNQIRTLKDPTAHAEMIAITQAAAYLRNERLKGCKIYVTIEPCAMCAGALVLARVEQIYFGAYDTKAGACGSVIDVTARGLLNHHIELIPGIMEEECRTLIQSFFAEKRAGAR
jgi:tRNA(adenine34) deaminase